MKNTLKENALKKTGTDYLDDCYVLINIHDNINFTMEQHNLYCNWTRTQNHLVLKRTLNQFGQMVECSFKN